jgi:hypothetical protein
MSDKKHTLDNLFALAKQQDPLLTKEQVHEFVNKAPVKAFPGKQLVNLFKNHLNLIIMSTIVSSIIIGMLMWVNVPKNDFSQKENIKESVKSENKNAIIVSTKNQNSIAKPPTQHKKQLIADLANTKFQHKTLVTKSADSLQLGMTLVADSISKLAPKATNQEPNNNSIISGEENILELTLDEFCKLGFYLTDSLFLNKSGLYYSYMGPGYLSSCHVITYNIDSSSTTINSLVLPARLLNKSYSRYTQDDYFLVFKTARYLLNPINYMPRNFTFKSRLNDSIAKKNEKRFEILNDTLVPITTLFIDTNQNKTASNIEIALSNHLTENLYWFYPNDSLYSHLPERYREKTKAFYENTKKLKRKMPDNTDLVKYHSLDLVFKTNPIDIDKAALERLGFEFFSDSFIYRDSVIKIYFERQRNGVEFIHLNSLFNELEYSPSYVSTESGELPISYSIGNIKGGKPKDFLKTTNRLIPIRVKKEYVPSENRKEDLIFWFNPTKSFFDALPKDIGNEIRQEYNALLIKDDLKISQEKKSQISSNCKYFEECWLTFDGLTNMNVYPNPAKDMVTVEVEFSKPVEHYIALYDIGGRSVKMFKKSDIATAGTHQYTFSLGSIPKGIYILAIRDNNGNTKTQRIIKQ